MKKQNTCRKQHIIPQFYQKKFSDTSKIFRYEKNKNFELNIYDNFAQNEYYSERPLVGDNKATLDQKITIKEVEYSQTLNIILNQPVNHELKIDQNINNLIYHFLWRNKYIMDYIFTEFAEKIILNKKNLEHVFSNLFYEANLRILNNKQINKKHCIYSLNIIYNNMLTTQKKLTIKNKKQYLNDAHLLSIENNSSLLNLNFKIKEGFFILPNNIITSYNGEKYLPFISENMEHILFPLSKNKVMIIYSNYEPIIDVNNINNILSSTCSSFCSDKSPEDADIINLIANLKNNNNYLESEINNLCDTIYQQLENEFIINKQKFIQIILGYYK